MGYIVRFFGGGDFWKGVIYSKDPGNTAPIAWIKDIIFGGYEKRLVDHHYYISAILRSITSFTFARECNSKACYEVDVIKGISRIVK